MSNKIDKVCCILPIFDEEDNIEEIISNIIKQSIGFNNINLTIVDGKSKEDTKKVIKRYAQKYSNITVKTVSCENNRLSELKNLGLSKLKDEFTIILDSKSDIDEDHIMNLYNGIKLDDSDICVVKNKNYNNINLNKVLNNVKDGTENKSENEKIFLTLNPLSNFIFKTRKIKNILFDENCEIVEDLLFKLKTLLNCNKINVITINDAPTKDSLHYWELDNDIELISNHYKNSLQLISNNESLKNKYNVLLVLHLLLKLEDVNDITKKKELFCFINSLTNDVNKEFIDVIRSLNDTKLILDIERLYAFIKQDNFELYLEDLNLKNKLKYLSQIERQRDNYKKLVAGKKLKLVIAVNKFISNLKSIYFSFVYYLTKPYFFKKDIWLIGERTDQAEDNSYHFFKYCRTNYKKKNIFYIIDKNSEQYNNIKEYGNVIQYDSFKHKLYLMHATKFISAYNFHKFSYPSNEIEFYRYIEKYITAEKIFIQHGVAMNSAPYYNQNINKYDYIVTSTQKETNMLIDKYNWDEKHILKTGLARYDNLEDLSKLNTKKRILFMPTWRSCLNGVSTETFKASNYYTSMYSFLTSERLNKLIKNNNLEFVFYIHYQMQDYIDLFEGINNNIKILEKSQANVQQLLKDSNLLITDFSSVGIDFAYMDKPVIFYQYNKDDFHYDINTNERFIMYKDFGIILDKEEEVLSELENWCKQKYKNLYEIKSNIFYNRDFNNCKRIFEFIDKIEVKDKNKVIVRQDDKNKNIIRMYNKNYTLQERVDFYPNGYPKKRYIYFAKEMNKVIEYNDKGKCKKISLYWNNIKYNTVKIDGNKYKALKKEDYLSEKTF